MWQQEFTWFFALFHQESCSAIKAEVGYPQNLLPDTFLSHSEMDI
jgi:hypothetical protein